LNLAGSLPGDGFAGRCATSHPASVSAKRILRQLLAGFGVGGQAIDFQRNYTASWSGQGVPPCAQFPHDPL